MAPSRSTPRMMQVTRAAFQAVANLNKQATDPKSHTLVRITYTLSSPALSPANSDGRHLALLHLSQVEGSKGSGMIFHTLWQAQETFLQHGQIDIGTVYQLFVACCVRLQSLYCLPANRDNSSPHTKSFSNGELGCKSQSDYQAVLAQQQAN